MMGPQRAAAGLLAVFLSLHTATALRAVSLATPVEKVISLLGRLEAQVQKEGAKEAAEYDKFACFCKEQADNKQHAIEKSDEKITELKAVIAKLKSEIDTLDADVLVLAGEIEGLEGDIKEETDARKAENDDYVVAEQNVTGAVEAVEEAIRVVKMSKSEMAKDDGVKLDLAAVARKLSSALPSPTDAQAKAVASLVAASKVEPGKPAAYEYRSNDIIATLESLANQFKENKKELYEEEFNAKAVSDKRILAWSNEKKFKGEAKIGKEKLSAKKSGEKEDAEKEESEETDDMNADLAFREELTGTCEERAKEWDQRSSARSGELTALAEAKEILKTGDVDKMYGSNKKLVGLAAKSVAVARANATVAKATSLLQVRRRISGADAAVRGAVERLGQLADKIGSPMLAALAAKVELVGGEDHFAKVRGLINDLIKKLQDEATDEATSKAFCDKNMGDSVGSRDEHKMDLEAQEATIKQKTVKISELQSEIAELSTELAELSKALNEATQLRSTEKAGNEQTLADAEQGKFAVTQAISVLEGFYSASLLQDKNPDREGKSVSDLAPEMSYEGDYKGNQDQSKGIIGLLNVILSDFERTEQTVGDEESAAVTEYGTFKGDTQKAMDDKQKLVGTKEGEIDDADVAITEAKDALKSAKALHEDSLLELERLKVMCVEGEDSYAERRKKREEEIGALRQALALLENWKP